MNSEGLSEILESAIQKGALCTRATQSSAPLCRDSGALGGQRKVLLERIHGTLDFQSLI